MKLQIERYVKSLLRGWWLLKKAGFKGMNIK